MSVWFGLHTVWSWPQLKVLHCTYGSQKPWFFLFYVNVPAHTNTFVYVRMISCCWEGTYFRSRSTWSQNLLLLNVLWSALIHGTLKMREQGHWTLLPFEYWVHPQTSSTCGRNSRVCGDDDSLNDERLNWLPPSSGHGREFTNTFWWLFCNFSPPYSPVFLFYYKKELTLLLFSLDCKRFRINIFSFLLQNWLHMCCCFG